MTQTKEVPRQHLEIITQNLGFAKHLAYQFYREKPNLGLELDDFIAAANLGLCDAARRFDPKRGRNFRTFSYLRIRGAMYDLLRRSGISRTYFSEMVPGNNANSQTGKRPKNYKLPYVFAQNIADLESIISVIEQFGIRLHIEINRRVEMSYANSDSPETFVATRQMKKYVRKLLKELPFDEREVLTRHYFNGQSFVQIRDDLGGMSKSWVSRVHYRALGKLKDSIIQDTRETQHRAGTYCA